MKVGVFGNGAIGKEVLRQSKEMGFDVQFTTDSKQVFDETEDRMRYPLEYYEDHLEKCDLVFVAIPTKDKGQTEKKFIEACLERKVPVVTCAKGAVGNFYAELSDAIRDKKLGITATVGGGSLLLSALDYKTQRIKKVHAVLNASVNYFMHGLYSGKEPGEVFSELQARHFVEPGSKSVLEMLNVETCRDIPLKTAILFNKFDPARTFVRAIDFKPKELNEKDLERLIVERDNRRFIVSITPYKLGEDSIGGFSYRLDGWHVLAGFRRARYGCNPLYTEKLLVPDETNALYLAYRDGETKYMKGVGAGPEQTVNSMMYDVWQMFRRKSPIKS